MKSMENIIGLKDLRQNMSTYINKVSKGNEYVVIKKSQPVFKIVPITDEDSWEPIVDFTKIIRGGVDINDVLAKL